MAVVGETCRMVTAGGKTSQNDSSSTARCDTSSATAWVRPSEDASENRSAKAQDLAPLVVLHVLPAPRAEEEENEPSSASWPMDTDHGGASVGPVSDDHAQVRSSTPASSSPDDRTNQSDKRSVQPASQPEQSKSNTGMGVKRDARAAELFDEDEQGGKFQQVARLTTVDAEDVPCEFSVKDDFEVDETAHSMEAFGIFGVCEELPKDAKIITTRWENVPKGDTWRCRFVARPHPHGCSFLCLVERTRTSMQRKTRKSTAGHPKNGSRGITPEEDEWRILGGRRQAAKKFHEFVVSATVGLGLEQCPGQPSLFRRPATALIFELHQDDFYVCVREQCMAPGTMGARLKLKLAEPVGPGSQYSDFRATRTRVDIDTIHIAPREISIRVSVTTSANRYASPDSPNATEIDEDEPRLGEEDRRAYRACVGIL